MVQKLLFLNAHRLKSMLLQLKFLTNLKITKIVDRQTIKLANKWKINIAPEFAVSEFNDFWVIFSKVYIKPFGLVLNMINNRNSTNDDHIFILNNWTSKPFPFSILKWKKKETWYILSFSKVDNRKNQMNSVFFAVCYSFIKVTCVWWTCLAPHKLWTVCWIRLVKIYPIIYIATVLIQGKVFIFVLTGKK